MIILVLSRRETTSPSLPSRARSFLLSGSATARSEFQSARNCSRVFSRLACLASARTSIAADLRQIFRRCSCRGQRGVVDLSTRLWRCSDATFVDIAGKPLYSRLFLSSSAREGRFSDRRDFHASRSVFSSDEDTDSTSMGGYRRLINRSARSRSIRDQEINDLRSM